MIGLTKKSSDEWIIQQEFADLIAGRNPKFPEIISEYPILQEDSYVWKIPFIEGGIQGYEITFRIGTFVDDKKFSEEYVKCVPEDTTPEIFIVETLKKNVINLVEKWKKSSKSKN